MGQTTETEAEIADDLFGDTQPPAASQKGQSLFDCIDASLPVAFDIETGPLPEEELRKVYREKTAEEFAATCDKRWKEDTVKAKYKEYVKTAWAEFAERAPLSPLTGRVLAIGYGQLGHEVEIAIGDELELIGQFWSLVDDFGAHGVKFVGHNSNSFDVPFLIRRSWALGIDWPPALIHNGRVQQPFIDTMEVWQCGNRQERVSLDVLARFFGLGAKPDDCDGASFHKLLATGKPEDRQVALDYLRNDVELTAKIADRIC